MSSKPAKTELIHDPSEGKKHNRNTQLQGEFPTATSRLNLLPDLSIFKMGFEAL